MATVKIVAFSGSLRRESWNQKLVTTAAAMARRAGAEVNLIHLRDLDIPLLDEDLIAASGIPAGVLKLKAICRDSHAMLISCPEYNSSMTSALKNAIDWLSVAATKPDGTKEGPMECFVGKIAAIFAASPGALGGVRGLPHIRQVLSNNGATVLGEQFALMKCHEAFDADANLKDDKQRASVEKIVQRLVHVASRLQG